MRTRKVVQGGVGGFASALALLTSGLTAAYFATGFLFDRTGWRPHPLVIQIINTLLGMCLIVAAVLITGILSGRTRSGPFAPIIEALQRIARGDFSARLAERHSRHGAVGELVQTVNDMAVKLDRMEKMRQEFISDVSHEIQSPLTSIRGFANALQQDNLSAEERRHYLEIIEAESVRLSKLSANLLKLTSLESDQVRFEPTTYRLDAQIRNLILACETQWAGKHLDMDVALAEAAISADEDLLSQVWTNLIHNSIKFTPEGGKVRVELQKRADRLEVSFSDTGIGISLEDQEHIFERFYKADRSRVRSAGGSGLGLAIAKKVVELHQGSIAVRSQPGTGSTFVVDLPVRSGSLN